MKNYMTAYTLDSLSDDDLLFIIKAFATNHQEYQEILNFVKSDPKVLLQMIDDPKVVKALSSPENMVLSISTFLFFFVIIRHSFIHYSHTEEFQEKVNQYKSTRGRHTWEENDIQQYLDDIKLHIYLANILTFFTNTAKMNDPQKTQNGWIYIFELLEKLKRCSPTNEFFIKAFIGNYTLCLTSFYKEYVDEKFQFGRRLVNCEYYAEYGEKFFHSAANTKYAQREGLSLILERLSIGFNIVRFALDELKHKDHFFVSTAS